MVIYSYCAFSDFKYKEVQVQEQDYVLFRGAKQKPTFLNKLKFLILKLIKSLTLFVCN